MSRESASETAAGCIVGLAMVPVSIILRGFVLCQLWLWFVVPLGVKEIGIAHALGLSTAISMFGGHSSSPDMEKRGDVPLAVWMVVMAVIPPLFCLLVGWIFHSFM